MKKTVCFVLVVCTLLSLIGCTSNSAPEDPPDMTIQRFVSALQAADFSAMGREFDPQQYSHDAVDMGEILGSFESEDEKVLGASLMDYMTYAAEKLDYEIIHMDIEDTQATATVKFTYIDCKPYFEDSLDQLIIYTIGVSSRGTPITQEAFIKRQSEILKDNIGKLDEEYMEETVEIPMVVRNGQWYIEELTDDLINISAMGIVKANQQLIEEDYFNKKFEELVNADN